MSALDGLFALLVDAVEDLAPVEARRMFGCPGLWADGNIFALVWKEGRIAVKLPLSADELRQVPGARDWTIGPKKKMGAWVLVPEAFHDDTDALARWARRAHAEVLAGAAATRPARRARGKRAKPPIPVAKASRSKRAHR